MSAGQGKEPDVTVAVATFNRADFLGEALASVLAQDYEAMEVLVVDNASTDATATHVRNIHDRRLRYVRFEQHVSMVENWNRCIELTRTPFMLIFHDDDRMYPSMVRTEVEFLRRHAEVVWVSAWADLQKANVLDRRVPVASRTGVFAPHDITRRLWRRLCPVIAPSVMARTEAYRAAGGFDPAAGLATDLDMWLRLSLAGPAGFIREPLMLYRLHSSNLTNAMRGLDVLGHLAHIHQKCQSNLEKLQQWRPGVSSADLERWYANFVFDYRKREMVLSLADGREAVDRHYLDAIAPAGRRRRLYPLNKMEYAWLWLACREPWSPWMRATMRLGMRVFRRCRALFG